MADTAARRSDRPARTPRPTSCATCCPSSRGPRPCRRPFAGLARRSCRRPARTARPGWPRRRRDGRPTGLAT
ncbi:hypothetical protein ACRAWD_28600 [Caulobacter segnis]